MSIVSIKLLCKKHTVTIIVSSLLLHITIYPLEVFWVLPQLDFGCFFQKREKKKTKTKHTHPISPFPEHKAPHFLLIWLKFIVSRWLKPHYTENFSKKKARQVLFSINFSNIVTNWLRMHKLINYSYTGNLSLGIFKVQNP